MIKNKKAYFDFDIKETEIAGILLLGSEVKPLRAGHASIKESFIYIKDNALWIKNMYIKNPKNNAYSHEEYRDRKLLLTKQQIKKWKKKVKEDRFTIIALEGYFDSKQKYKLKIGLAKGKKTYDKKNSIRDKDMKK
jgi:SsrA-binding protein